MKTRMTGLVLAFAFVGLTSLPSLAQVDLEQRIMLGQALYKKDCSGCHGAQGISRPEASAPHLAGQKSGYVKDELMNFRSGVRPGRMMGDWLKKLSVDDIENLALYISTLERVGCAQ